MTTGIVSIDDLRAVRYASAASFGLDTISKVLSADLEFYNGLVNEQMNYLAVPLTEQARVWGSSATIGFQEMDEFGKPISAKNTVGSTVMFPIRVFAAALGFTEKWLQLHTPAELVERYDQIKRGHAENMLLRIRKAIFNDGNFTQVDPFNSVSLSVKRLLNADSTAIPDFGGKSFTAASHTHYLAVSGSECVNADIDDLFTHVSEHGMTKGLKLFINQDQKANVTGLSKFTALSSDLIAYGGVNSTIAKLDFSDMGNQFIGYWDNSHEVWVKPSQMIPADYVMVAATEEVEKVLGYRQLPAPELQGLRIDAQYSNFPLVAQNAEWIGDFGVWNRMGAAVMITSGSTWVDPTLTVNS